MLQDNLALTNRRGQELHGSRCLEGLAELALAQGATGAALAYAGQLFELAEPRGMREAAARACWLRGQALLQAGRLNESEAALLDAAAREQHLGRPRLASDIHQSLAELHRRQNRLEHTQV
jgi:hypothetical protein